MAQIELYGKEYEIRSFICSHKKYDEIETKPSVRLYVRLTNSCNANCKFCLNHQNKSKDRVSKEKLGEVIKYLKSKDVINAVTLTGGEPMLDFKYLNEIINLILEIDPNMRISISTNGTNLKEFLNFDNVDKLDAIHISRHHVSDEINNEILGVKTASLEDIKYVQDRLKNKRLIIVNSVMMNGYIENFEDVKKLADELSYVGINRVHVVSMIDYNDYCREKYIDVYKIFNDALKNDDSIFRVTDRYRKDFCECHEYAYITKYGKEIHMLARKVKSNNSDYIEQLVFTNENKLITGFDSNDVLFC